MLAALLLAFGCGSDLRAGNVVELWALGREGEVVREMIPAIERRVPGVRVRVQQIPWSAAHEKLLTAFVGGSMPDLFQLGNTWIPEFVALNALEDLEEYVASSKTVAKDDFFPGVFDTNVIDGRAYALPWYVDTRLLFYRRDLLASAGHEAAPRTWEEWIEAAQAIMERAGRNRYAILLPMNEWQPTVIFALQLGADLLRGDEEYGNFRSEEFRRAFHFYLGFYRRGLAPRAAETQIANLYQDFADGFFAFYVTGPWNVGEFRRRLPADRQDIWRTAPMPAPDASHPALSLAGGASLAIARGSTRKREAWQVLEALLAEEQQLELYRLTGDLPSRRGVWADAALAGDAKVQAFRTQLEHAAATPKIPEWERIADKIAHYTEAVVRGDIVPDEALERLDADVDRLLEKRRWLLARGRAG